MEPAKAMMGAFCPCGCPPFFCCGSRAVHNCHPWFTFLKTLTSCSSLFGKRLAKVILRSQNCARFMLMSHGSWVFFVLHRYYQMLETSWHSVSWSFLSLKVSETCPSIIMRVVRWALALEGFASILQLNVPSGHPLAFHEIGRDLEVGKPEDVQGIERYP